MIPFSPPYIREEAIAEVIDTLKSGWITTGPKTKQFERNLTEYCGNSATLCVNSATFGLELILRWFGVGNGDEVIIPAYTYTATASIVVHTGAKPIMVDVNKDDFNISVKNIKQAITPRTKVIIPVDFGGFPADVDSIFQIINSAEIKSLFTPNNDVQKKLGRILILTDSAHSLGALYKNRRIGSVADISVFSFHAVKNLTTAEGGAIALNLPSPFENDKIYKELNILSLHGQTKDALSKTKVGGWRYDVINPAYKGNMTDIQASLGLVALKYYQKETLPKRRYVFDRYTEVLEKYDWAQVPIYEDEIRKSSYHVYALRIKNIDEKIRDQIIEKIYKNGVAVNVHFQPLPMLTAYKKMGYRIEDYPIAYNNYSQEISLPVYEQLTDKQIDKVLDTVITAVEDTIK